MSGYDLADAPDGVGEFLLRRPCLQATLAKGTEGGTLEQVRASWQQEQ